ncbi:MAG: hypothetical protein JNM10_09455 [Planctomycetia bacterium]|nr:hypothetical protein [Planctomycetia bacterium]
MRPLVLLLALCAFLLVACQSPGPSTALEVQPAVGAGARVFAGPQDGVGAAARLDLGKYGLRTGKAAEPAPVAAPPGAATACPGGVCPLPAPDPLRVPEAPAPDAGSRP